MDSRPWRLLLDPPGSADWNMSVDESLLLHTSGPVLRFYRWSAPTVNLGYRQEVPEWVDRCTPIGVETVRRISGGGTLLHHGDLTYAVVAPRGDDVLPDTLVGSYEWIRETLVEGLRRAGLPVRASDSVEDADRLDLCFAAATGYEVEIDGQKLIGSAQRRTSWGFLQHGSIRLHDDSELYRQLTGSTPGEKPPTLTVDADRVIDALVATFDDKLAGKLERGTLSDEEIACAENRVSERRRQRLTVPPLALSTFARSADRLP